MMRFNSKQGLWFLRNGKTAIVRHILVAIALLAAIPAARPQSWEEALRSMPMPADLRELNHTNCIPSMLEAFQPNANVKALIFMPGSTSELYLLHRARASLTMPSPTLLDAVNALTNQTFIHATFLDPMLLLHTDEDVLTPSLDIEDATAAEKLKRSRLVPEIMSIDRDWDFMEPILSGGLRADVRPWPTSADSWHFYRHNLAAWNLNGMEAIEAITFAGKTHATLRRGSLFELRRIQVIFQTDRRAQP